MKILDCTFEENAGATMHIGSADGVEIRGNRIAHRSVPVVLIVNSRNVTVSGNSGLPEKGGVEIKGSSDRATIKVEGNR